MGKIREPWHKKFYCQEKSKKKTNNSNCHAKKIWAKLGGRGCRKATSVFNSLTIFTSKRLKYICHSLPSSPPRGWKNGRKGEKHGIPFEKLASATILRTELLTQRQQMPVARRKNVARVNLSPGERKRDIGRKKRGEGNTKKKAFKQKFLRLFVKWTCREDMELARLVATRWVRVYRWKPFIYNLGYLKSNRQF